MKVTLMGYRILDFQPKEKDSKPICGTKVYFANCERNVVGKTVSDCFVPAEMLEIICFNLDEYIGKEIDAEFNSKGKVVALTLLDTAA